MDRGAWWLQFMGSQSRMPLSVLHCLFFSPALFLEPGYSIALRKCALVNSGSDRKAPWRNYEDLSLERGGSWTLQEGSLDISSFTVSGWYNGHSWLSHDGLCQSRPQASLSRCGAWVSPASWGGCSLLWPPVLLTAKNLALSWNMASSSWLSEVGHWEVHPLTQGIRCKAQPAMGPTTKSWAICSQEPESACCCKLGRPDLLEPTT